MNVCLKNSFTYHIDIFDSFGDGICCSEGNGKYTISIDGNVVKEGGDYKDSEDFIFKFMDCTSDFECDDLDPCTNDECKSETSLCLYTFKPCSQCGATATVSVLTDFYSFES